MYEKLLWQLIVEKSEIELSEECVKSLRAQMEILHLVGPSIFTPVIMGIFRRESDRDELIKFIRKSSAMSLLPSRIMAAKARVY